MRLHYLNFACKFLLYTYISDKLYKLDIDYNT